LKNVENMTKSKYSDYGLDANPFLAETHDYPLVAYEPLLSNFLEKLKEHSKQKGAMFYFIIGAYGSGKSKFLYEVENYLKLNNYMLDDVRILVAWFDALAPKPTTKYLSGHLLPNIFRKLGKNTLRSLKNELAGIQNIKILQEIRSRVDANLLNALNNFSTTNEELAWEWFNCNSLRAGDLRRINVRYNINSDSRAKILLVDFLKLLHYLNYDSLLILLDEFEYMIYQKRKASQYLEYFRDLYNTINEEASRYPEKKIANLFIMFACTPDALREIEALGPLGTPFRERVHPENYYVLPSLDREQVRELIAKRLKVHRTNRAPSDIYPFEEDTITFVHEQSDGRPRIAISISYSILEGGLASSLKSIDSESAKEILINMRRIVTPQEAEREIRRIPLGKRRRPRRVERKLDVE